MKMAVNSLIKTLLIPTIILGLLSGCGDNSAARRHQAKATNVHVTTVVRQGLVEQQFITGTLEALRTVRIYNQEPGRIKSLPYYPGDTVEKGQLITIIDDSILKHEFEKAQAQHRQAKLVLKRVKRLVPSKLASDEQLTQAETLVERTGAEKNLFKTRLSYSRIHAPIAGVITQRLPEEGDVVPIHSHLLSIADVSQLKITLSLSELSISQLRLDMIVSLQIDALGDEKFAGKILRIHPTIDTASRQGTVVIILNEVPVGAIPGQLTRIAINTTTAPRITIPIIAIQNDSIGEYVYRVDEENKAKLVRIHTGIQVKQWVEIISGLKVNDTIVTNGFQGLVKSNKINIIDKNSKKISKMKKESTDKKKSNH